MLFEQELEVMGDKSAECEGERERERKVRFRAINTVENSTKFSSIQYIWSATSGQLVNIFPKI